MFLKEILRVPKSTRPKDSNGQRTVRTKQGPSFLSRMPRITLMDWPGLF